MREQSIMPRLKAIIDKFKLPLKIDPTIQDFSINDADALQRAVQIELLSAILSELRKKEDTQKLLNEGDTFE